jgi:hypothetical protein
MSQVRCQRRITRHALLPQQTSAPAHPSCWGYRCNQFRCAAAASSAGYRCDLHSRGGCLLGEVAQLNLVELLLLLLLLQLGEP